MKTFSFTTKTRKKTKEVYVTAPDFKTAVNKLFKVHPRANVESVWIWNGSNAVPEIIK